MSSAAQPVQAIMVDAIGAPGSRVFYFQAQADSGELQTLIIEKTQAMLLAEQIDDLLNELFGRYPALSPGAPMDAPALREPKSVMFRAGHFALQYSVEADVIGLEISELRGIDQGTPRLLRVWATRPQLRALADHARRVARSGMVSRV